MLAGGAPAMTESVTVSAGLPMMCGESRPLGLQGVGTRWPATKEWSNRERGQEQGASILQLNGKGSGDLARVR